LSVHDDNLFPKRVVRTNFDIYLFITSIPIVAYGYVYYIDSNHYRMAFDIFFYIYTFINLCSGSHIFKSYTLDFGYDTK